jgi:hypothetical protein
VTVASSPFGRNLPIGSSFADATRVRSGRDHASSSRDSFEAIGPVDWLAEVGWSEAFLDLDPERRIAAGECWERRLHEASQRCEAMIFLVSRNGLASGWLAPWQQTFKPCYTIGAADPIAMPGCRIGSGPTRIRLDRSRTDLRRRCAAARSPNEPRELRHDQPPLETPPARLELGRFRP